MRKQITELSEDYFESVHILDELIEKYRARLSEVKQHGSRTELQRVEGLLVYYYAQRNDLLDTGHYLKNYYKTSKYNLAV